MKKPDDIPRYSLTICGMEPDEYGDFVKWNDAAECIVQYIEKADALRRELDDMRYRAAPLWVREGEEITLDDFNPGGRF